MKHTGKNISILLVALATLLLLFVGCSDMMVKMGEIVLQIEPEDTIRTEVASYSVIGNLENSRSTISFNDLKPGEDVVIPKIASGTWTFTVTAFDSAGEIGTGTKAIVLTEGQNVNLKIPVEFKRIQLTIPNQTLSAAALSKVYDGNNILLFNGDETFTVEASELIGLRTVANSEKDTVLIEARATYDDKIAGTDKVITVSYVLIYSGDPSITGKYDAPISYTATEKGTITQKQLTITAPSFTDSTDKVYDGNASIFVTAGNLSGVLESDEVTANATAAYSDTNVGTGKVITVAYTLMGNDALNYASPAPNTVNTGNVTPKPLTFTVVAEDKTYDGDVADAGHIILDGIVASDDVHAIGTFIFSDKNAGSDKTVNVTGITLGGAQAGNYSISINTASTTAEIQKRALTTDGTYLTRSKVYDRNLTAQVGIDQVNSGKVRGDSIVLSVEAYYADSSVSENKTIAVSYTLTGDKIQNYIKPADYTVTTGSVTPIPLSISNPSIATSKPYDGNDNLSVTKGTLSGFLTGDTVSVTATAKYGDKNVGTNKEITVSYALDQVNANYLAPVSYTVTTGVITAIPLTIGYSIFPTSNTKVYDGNTTIPVIAGALSGILPAEKGTVTVKAEASYSSADVVPAKTITVKYTLCGLDAANYTAPKDSTGIICSITPKKLKVYADTTQIRTEKSYDGTDVAQVLARGVLDGLVGSDRVTLTTAATYRGGVDAGQGKIIDVTYSIEGADASNYSKPDDYTILNGAIKAIQLGIQEPTFSDTGKVYSGTTSFDKTRISLDQNSLTGVATGDAVSVNVATAAYGDENVGVNKDITVSYALVEANANYLAPVNSTINTGVIKQKQLIIGNPNFTNTITKPYDGTDSVVFTKGDVIGLYDPSDVTVNATGEYLNVGVGTNKHIRITYSLTGTKAGNYSAPDSYLTTSGEITKKALTVEAGTTVIEPSKTYDGTSLAKVTRQGRLEGLVGTEDVTLEATASYGSRTAASDKTITVTYALTGVHAGNYTAPAGYTIRDAGITKKALTVKNGTTQIKAEKLFDDTTYAEVITAGALVGVLGNDAVTLGASASYNDKTVAANKAMTVVYSLSGDDAANYAAPSNNTAFTGRVTNGQLIISNPILVKTKTYNSADDCTVFPGNTLQGIVGSDIVQVEARATYADKNVGTGKEITVEYSLTGRDALKYTAPNNYVANDGEIQQRQLTISAPTVTNASKPYDGTTSVVFTAGTVSGKYSADTVKVVPNGFYLSSAVGNDKRIFFTYTLEGPDAGNYIRPSYDVIYSGSITPKVLDVRYGSTVIAGKTYDKTSTATVTNPGTLLGVIGTEKVILSATATYDEVTVGDRNLTVTYSLSGVHAENYSKPSDNTNDYRGVITKRQLTVSGTTVSSSKVYDGNTSAMVSDHGTLNGVVAGDIVSVSAAANYMTKDVSTDAKAITVVYGLGGLDMGNYSKPADNTTGYTGAITKKQLTVSGTTVASKKGYDGTTSATVSDNGTLNGVITGDIVSVSAAANYLTKDVSSIPKAIKVVYEIGGLDVGNYSKPADNITDYTGAITKRQLTIASQNLTANKDYDGNNTAVISGVVLDGVVSNEDVSTSAIATYDTKGVGTGKPITLSYPLGGTGAGSYLQPVNNTAVGVITKRQLTVSGTTVSSSKVYDGNTSAMVSDHGTLNGVVAGDIVSVSAAANYMTKDVSTDAKAITVVYGLGGLDMGNYSKPADNTTGYTGAITKKQLTVSGTTVASKKGYDGTTSATVSDNGTLNGVITGDIVSVSAAANYLTKDVSSIPKAIKVVYEIGGLDVGNYSKPADNITDFTGTIEVAVGLPTFSPNSGSYASNQSISLSSITDGATIRYTTDGSDPSQSYGTVYNGPFHMFASYTIKAIAYKSGFIDSPIASGNFTIINPALAINPSSISKGTIGQNYNFTLTATGIPVGVSSVTFNWNFGDGSTGNILASVSNSSASTTISHTYRSNSVFGLIATVASGSTTHASATASITIGTPVVRPDVDLSVLNAWKAAAAGGTGLTADSWKITNLPDNCQFDLRYDMYGMPDRIIIEYPVGTVKYDSGWRGDATYEGNPTYPGGIQGIGQNEILGIFRKIDSSDIKVTVIGGASGTAWKYDMRARL